MEFRPSHVPLVARVPTITIIVTIITVTIITITRAQKEFKEARQRVIELSKENDELAERQETLHNLIRDVKHVRISAQKTLQALEEDGEFYREQLKQRSVQEL
ncbi:hypothetical protein ACOMHN_066052 [Nucella lapillus]